MMLPLSRRNLQREQSTDQPQGVDYAGIKRSIIYRNPPLVDDEGYELDSEDDEERVADAVQSAAELNPYADVRLEREQTKVGFAQKNANETRCSCALGRFDRFIDTSDHVETVYIANSDRLGGSQLSPHAEREPVIMGSATAMDVIIR